jgi:hypothetical protein
VAKVQRLAEQVHGILSRKGVEFATNENETSFQVPYESTACYIETREWGDLSVLEIRAIVLENVDAGGRRRGKILERLNEINRDGFFGTIYLAGDEKAATIFLEHQLVGDDLDAAELMNALSTVASRADELDDDLIKAFETGERWTDVEARTREEGTGPTIST